MRVVTPKQVFRATVKQAVKGLNEVLMDGHKLIHGQRLSDLRLDEKPILKVVVKKFRKHGWCVEIKHDANRSTVVTALWFKSPKTPSSEDPHERIV